MRTLDLGGLTARVVGGSDRRGGGEGPIVVLLHGFGAPGEDLVGLWRVLDVPRDTRFVFPEAPIDLGAAYMGGRAWWHLDAAALDRSIATGVPRDLTPEDPPALASARDRVVALLDAVETQLGAPEDGIVLGGFSQGAMLSLDVALTSPRALAGLVLLSGSFLAEARWTPAMAKRAGLRVFQSHGRRDALLGFAYAVRLREALRGAGVDVEWHEFAGGHEIPPGVLDALGAFLTRCASPAS